MSGTTRWRGVGGGARGLVAVVALLAIASGCREATQLLVVVDSDLAPGSELRTVRVVVSSPRSFGASHEVDVTEEGLPFSFGVTPPYGPGDVVELRADGLGSDEGGAVVWRSARVGFVEGRAILVELPLARDCAFLELECADGETCGDGECVDAALDAEALPAVDPAAAPTPLFDGPSPPRDAGVGDDDGGGGECEPGAACDTGDPCVPGTTICDGDLPTCSAGSPLPEGSACGSGRTCDAEGRCGA